VADLGQQGQRVPAFRPDVGPLVEVRTCQGDGKDLAVGKRP
jgi:hypothetical protein